jgi:hypothetical protein
VQRCCCAGNTVSNHKVFHRLSLVDWTEIVKSLNKGSGYKDIGEGLPN